MFDPFSPPDEGNDSTADLEESIRSVPRGTFRAFVLAALLAQAGLFAVSLGLMLVGFREQWTVGGALVSGGVVAFFLTVLVYRRHHAST